MALKEAKNEPTLYVKRHDNGEFRIVCIYVDDIIYFGSPQILVAEFKSCMKKEFEMIDLGVLHYFLGHQVKQVEDGIFLSQEKYARDLLSRHGMLNCKAVATPMNSSEKLQLEDGTGAIEQSI